MSAPHSAELLDALADAQGIGFLGARPIPLVVQHADAFLEALSSVSGRLIDLGSGGGVPGLVIADVRPDLEIVLLDRRGKRTDFLTRVVRRLGWTDRVQVVHADAIDQARVPGWASSFDAVVSRGFGPPDTTLSMSELFVRPGGLVVLSDPPADQEDRWRTARGEDRAGLRRLSEPGRPVVTWQKV